MSHDFLFKFILLGDSGVGKTALLHRFTEPWSNSISNFASTPYQATVGIDFKTRTIPLTQSIKVMIMAWDSAGSEAFRSLTHAYYRGVAVALLVYDVGQPASFHRILSWLEDLRRHADNPNLVLVLVGNKKEAGSQTEVQVSSEEGARLAERLEIPLFFETSALTGENVEQAFVSGAELFYAKYLRGEVDISSDAEGLTLGPRQIKGGRGSGGCGC